MIFGLWGLDKTCKTSLALSFPKPLVEMEFDIGGFKRACRNLPNLPISDWYKQGLIQYEAYPMPIHIGKFDQTTLQVRPSKIIVGMKEIFYKWLSSYLKHLEDPKIATIVVDTGTLLYSITCDGYLQEKQELQLDTNGNLLPNEKLRVQLQQIEYREPNNRMRGIIYNAKAAGKHLVLVHHARDEYKPMLQKDGTIASSATGKKERAGFATLGDSADVIVNTYWDTTKKKPYCKVELAEVKELEGMVFEEPTYDKIAKVIQMIRGES